MLNLSINQLAELTDNLLFMRDMQKLTGDLRQEYHFKVLPLKWGEGIPKDLCESMKQNSEVVIVLDKDEKPNSFVIWDSISECWRQKLIS